MVGLVEAALRGNGLIPYTNTMVASQETKNNYNTKGRRLLRHKNTTTRQHDNTITWLCGRIRSSWFFLPVPVFISAPIHMSAASLQHRYLLRLYIYAYTRGPTDQRWFSLTLLFAGFYRRSPVRHRSGTWRQAIYLQSRNRRASFHQSTRRHRLPIGLLA